MDQALTTKPKAIAVGNGATLFPYNFLELHQTYGLHPLQAPWPGMLSLSNPKSDAGQIKPTIIYEKISIYVHK